MHWVAEIPVDAAVTGTRLICRGTFWFAIEQPQASEHFICKPKHSAQEQVKADRRASIKVQSPKRASTNLVKAETGGGGYWQGPMGASIFTGESRERVIHKVPGLKGVSTRGRGPKGAL